MAVHLNAHLKTRFVPYLFTIAILVIVTTALAHASASDSSAPIDDSAPTVTREELQAVMSESVDPGRLDRRPGFSEIIVAPRPGERPSTGIFSARKEEEPPPVGGSSPSTNTLDFSDELPAQPGEPSSGQR